MAMIKYSAAPEWTGPHYCGQVVVVVAIVLVVVVRGVSVSICLCQCIYSALLLQSVTRLAMFAYDSTSVEYHKADCACSVWKRCLECMATQTQVLTCMHAWMRVLQVMTAEFFIVNRLGSIEFGVVTESAPISGSWCDAKLVDQVGELSLGLRKITLKITQALVLVSQYTRGYDDQHERLSYF